MDVPAFLIDRYKVTNGEYLEFVRAGGPAPVFGTKKAKHGSINRCSHQIPLPLDSPDYVSHDEPPDAKWAGKSLPTEAQWQRAACTAPRSGNFDFARWDPVPVTAFGAGGTGAQDMWGNGWEWTSTLFAPFPGFQPFPFYPGYSANFFDGQHYVMRAPGAHRGVHAAALFPELVPAALSLRVRGIPLREERMILTALANDVIAGLSQAGQKELPSKYLYDAVGSRLFDVITELPDTA